VLQQNPNPVLKSNMQYFTKATIGNLDRIYRANFINSITGYKPGNLVGTISKEGIANLAIFSSVVHLGADPALIGFIQRPLTATSHTFKNIIHNGVYTINHIHHSIAEKAHYTSAKFEDGISEFDTCGLVPEYIENFAAPFVKESVIKIGLQLVETIPIKHNNTTLVIGSIQHILLADNLQEQDGTINLATAGSIACSGLDTYYTAATLAQYPYAKADELPWRK
jgi:flavin reductase (DIM6/NTAB) family NADH-FMN oxidoreductase RutF